MSNIKKMASFCVSLSKFMFFYKSYNVLGSPIKNISHHNKKYPQSIYAGIRASFKIFPMFNSPEENMFFDNFSS